MKYATVCSGIEAPSVAWHPLGWKCEFVSEIEPFPCAVLKHHYPNVPNLGDMTKYHEWPKRKLDVLIGGTPCQSFSVAGLRKGMDDPRGNLALVFLGIVDKFRPTWVCWENVPGVHSSWSHEANRGQTKETKRIGDDARRLAIEAGFDKEAADRFGEFEEVDQSNDFDYFLAAMDQLGYGVATTILDAQFFGLAQRRERVFVVGHIGGQWQRASAVLFDATCLRGDSAPSREKREGVAPTISSRTKGGGGLGTDADCDGAVIPVAGTMQKHHSNTQLDQTFVPEAIPFDTTQVTSPGNYSNPKSGDPVHPLAEGQHAPAVVIPINMQVAAKNGTKSPNMLGIGKAGDPAHTVNASDQHAVAIAFEPGIAMREGGHIYEDISGTIHSKAGDNQMAVAHSLKSRHDGSEDRTGRGTPIVAATLTKNYATHHGRTAGKNGGVADGQLVLEISPAMKQRDFKGPSSDGSGDGLPLIPEVAQPVRSQVRSNSDPSMEASMHIQTGMAVRRLTPKECARLQGFPDSYLDITFRGKPACDGPKYKALGNSMATPVVRWIGQRIEMVEAIK